MATIYQQTHGALMAQPGRSVSTFPSGLCRVDQTYICATQDAATHRAALAIGNAMPDGYDYPSLETLAIHPEAQEIRRGDGFTEFRVSAYGQTTSPSGGTTRTLSNIQIVPKTTWTNVSKIGEGRPGIVGDIYLRLWSITGMVVVPLGYVPNIATVDYDDALNDAFDFYQTEGNLLSYTKISDSQYDVVLDFGVVGRATLTAPTMAVASYSNFGKFAEVTVSIQRGVITTNIELP